MFKKTDRKGFTIVELVIVIAVIAILATVLIPTFGNMIDKANNTKTIQALKNEYTEYILSVDVERGETIEEDITIRYNGDFYEIENGAPKLTDGVAVALPENERPTNNYWDATTGWVDDVSADDVSNPN